MHRFFFLLIIWILVEAYWIAPNEKIEVQDFTQTRSVEAPLMEKTTSDTLEEIIEPEIFE